MVARKSGIRLVLLSSIVLLLGGCVASSASENSRSAIHIGGSAEALEVLEVLQEAYPDNTEFEFFVPNQTDGGIAGVEAGHLDVGGVSRDLFDHEVGDLSYVPLAEVPLVMVTHPSVVGVSDVSADEIRGIYSGTITNWQALGGPDAPIVLLDLAEDENEKRVLRETYLGTQGITPSAQVFHEEHELLEAAATTEFSIAAAPLEEEISELGLNILSIDGITPSAENLRSGSYPMGLKLGVVVSEEASGATQNFMNFAVSSDGDQVLADVGYVAID